MKKPVALILGITGQDGSYLAKFLLDKGFEVFGTTRDSINANINNLTVLNIKKDIKLLTTSITSFRSLLITIEQVNPDFIFHLAGQSSVGLSFKLPFEAIESISISTLNLLEAVRFFNKKIKIFLPCSSDCFGNIDIENPANENTPLNPLSPYAVAKSSAYWLAKSYRSSYGMFISVGFLSNHESPLRGSHFVTSKIFTAIRKIKNKEISKVSFGNLEIIRDWGWAPSYVKAIYKIINYDKPEDFIVASGKSYSLKQFLDKAFLISGLGDADKYIYCADDQKRPNEIKNSYLNPTKAKDLLSWENDIKFEEMIYKLINSELT